MEKQLKKSEKICTVEECTKTVIARGWCSTHYGRWRRGGDPLYWKPSKASKPCEVDGCGISQVGRGYCNRHYAKWYRLGDPLAGTEYQKTPDDRFEAYSYWQGDCLIWTNSITQHGYGYLSHNGKSMPVHRYTWEQEHGPIPAGKTIDHIDICTSRACCNVKHLRLATPSENSSNRKGATRRSKTGARNVHQIANGRYEVEMQRQGQRYHFGYFDTVEEAAKVAAEKRAELFGEFAGRG